MTWPFENDTSVIVKKLAKRNVSSNRIFCFFNVLTIALAISLIVGISLFQHCSKISEQKILNQMQQATIGGLTAEQIEVLKKEPDLEDIVPYKHILIFYNYSSYFSNLQISSFCKKKKAGVQPIG